jgi:sigma-B regulation protein RsbU (phosphoserine phosphatase)
VGFYVLDVCGHGVGAALLSASIQRWLSPVRENSCLFVPDAGAEGKFAIAAPATVANDLNRWFWAEPESGKFFTLIYGVLALRSGEFRYATAGHAPPLRVGRDRAEACAPAQGPPIGVLEDFEFGEVQLQLRPGDRLLLYTDGASEATDASDRLYGSERLLHDLEQQQQRAPDQALAALLARLRAWGGSNALEDDVTLLMVDATGE